MTQKKAALSDQALPLAAALTLGLYHPQLSPFIWMQIRTPYLNVHSNSIKV